VKSIRSSLLLYFLLLLGVALSAVSVLAYRHTEKTLAEKESSRRELLRAQMEENCRREMTRLDDALELQASYLGRSAQLQFGRMRFLVFTPLGLLSAAQDPVASLSAPIWFVQQGPSGWFEYLSERRVAEINFNEDILPRLPDAQVTEYFQIDVEGGRPWLDSAGGRQWRSRSMGTRSFPINSHMFADLPLYEYHFDDLELEPTTEFGSSIAVRRVTLKTPISRQVFFPRPRPRPGRERPPGTQTPRPVPPSGERARTPSSIERTSTEILIRCAAETRLRDAAIAAIQNEYDLTVAVGLRQESKATLASVRNWLVFISLTTFAATFLGGLVLVRFGLSPLRRLSEAVSRVSPKNFQLQVDAARLPNELRPIVDRLTQTLELLKGSFAREKQAAADISHELRTPLAALLTTLEVGLRKTRSAEEYQTLLTDCHAIGQQLSRLVERLLALARLDAGVDTLRPRQVDLTALADQCAAVVRPLAEARNLSFRFDRNGPIQLRADPDKLSEILTNLLHNAIEYNRPKGTVELAVAQKNGHVVLAVRDTGIGISAQARDHIFERFYRADPARQADGLHAGLGLAIVKGYVEMMGGEIHVNSVEGQGSTFEVCFPVSPAK
jgi:heavy metal sensor kinase